MPKRVFLLGAGASRECKPSATGFRSPLSRDFFELLERVHGENPAGMRIAPITNYVAETRGSYGTEEGPFRADIEAFMTEIEEKARAGGGFADARWLSAKQARDALMEALPIALNRVQAGPTCNHYGEFVSILRPDDVVISLNWDTFFDRALAETGKWFVDDGYAVNFLKIFDEGWRDGDASKQSAVRYFKLHGSMNWLLDWMTYDQNGRLAILADGNKALRPLCFVGGSAPYETWDDGNRVAPYPFSYPYAPKCPVHGTPTMAAIIPPVHRKLYGMFADFLEPIWEAAEAALVEASEWFIVGYSFPKTDEAIAELLARACSDGKDIWVIEPFGRRQEIADKVGAVLKRTIAVHAPRMGFAKFVECLAKYGSAPAE
jgi:hypothetical protein